MMTLEMQLTIPFILFLLITLIGLMLVIRMDPYIRKDQKKTMRLTIFLVLTLVLQNFVEDQIAEGSPMPVLRTWIAIYGYSVRPVILILLIRIVEPEKEHRSLWILAVINTIIYLTALFSRICFVIDEENHFKGGPLRYTCLTVSLILIGYFLYLTVHRYRPERKPELIIPVFNIIMIIFSVIMDSQVGSTPQPITYLTFAVGTSCVFYYIWLHQQFVRDHELDLITGQKTRIMMAQIRPHFLYNSLTAIRSVCQKDPAKAEEAITQFSEYLRYNMDSLEKTAPVPFEEEMRHVRRYLGLQKLRFEDDLQVEYDLQYMDFTLPVLTVQPLVENAVTWGIRKSETGCGVVSIRSRKCADHIEISVVDNGIGFETDSASEDLSKSHIGLKNVRERLKRMSDGELKIESVPGQGTTAVIILPKEDG